MITRRSILFGLVAAPVVVRVGLIMPVKAVATQRDLIDWIVWNRTHRNWQSDYAAYDPYENDGWGINWPFVSGEIA